MNYWLTRTWSNFWSRTTPSLDLEDLRIGGYSSSTMIGTSIWMETSIVIEGKLSHWRSMCNLCICGITLLRQSDGEHNESLWRMLRSWWVPVNLNRATQCWDWGVFLNGKLSWLTIRVVFSLREFSSIGSLAQMIFLRFPDLKKLISLFWIHHSVNGWSI